MNHLPLLLACFALVSESTLLLDDFLNMTLPRILFHPAAFLPTCVGFFKVVHDHLDVIETPFAILHSFSPSPSAEKSRYLDTKRCILFNVGLSLSSQCGTCSWPIRKLALHIKHKGTKSWFPGGGGGGLRFFPKSANGQLPRV